MKKYEMAAEIYKLLGHTPGNGLGLEKLNKDETENLLFLIKRRIEK